MSAPKLQLVNLRKEFSDGTAAVDGINLVLDEGQTLALLGPSGCGKSTTLNMVVGLEQPTAGDIHVDGESVLSVPAGKRNIGLVFQDYAVFTSMTVRDNLAFGLSVRGYAKVEVDRAVGEIAELLGLSKMLKSKAAHLGGSELQRVAIGRTLITKPSILLLDEPLSNLEAAARLATRRELRRLQKEIGLTIIYVTHDQVEALSLADKIAVMSAGKIMQVGSSSTICQQPDNIFVAGFMGSPPMNLLRGRVERRDGSALFFKDKLAFPLPVELFGDVPHDVPIVVGVRPEDVRIGEAGQAGLPAVVRSAEPRGSETILALETNAQVFKAIVNSDNHPADGANVTIDLTRTPFVLFNGETDGRLTGETAA